MSLDVWVINVDTGDMNAAPQPSPSSRPRQLLASLRADLRERSRVRASYRELERSLAAVSSPSEIGDLLAMIAQQDGPDVQRVRRVLARKLHDQATHRIAA